VQQIDGFAVEVGLKIAFARKKAGYSQDEIADLIGIPRTGFVKIEAGKQKVHFDHICAIASATGFNVTFFIPSFIDEKALSPGQDLETFKAEILEEVQKRINTAMEKLKIQY
jgi:transcriptional regulator with XRE-family HTH domain